MQKRVLITGGTGFIGSNVVGELAKKGYEIHLAAIPPFPNKCKYIAAVHEINLMDFNSVDNFLKKKQI